MIEDGRLLDEERADSGGARLAPLAVIDGDDDDNVLNGTGQDDQIEGRGGNDDIRGRGGSDDIGGGSGDDVIRGGPGSDTVRGNSGDDRVIGGNGGDELSGGPDNDVVNGQGGADVMDGDGGDDQMNGGGRGDTMRGGGGADTMSGGGGGDSMSGGGGDDVMSGDGGADVMTGNAGDDQLDGGNANDLIRGGRGADTLLGGKGADELLGGGGADVIDGGRGFNVASGGGGIDTFQFTDIRGQMQIRDFDPDNEILDFSEIIDFTPGDGIRNFVRFDVIESGTEVFVSPDGNEDEFQLIAGLVGVEIDRLPRDQLGFADDDGGGGGGGGGVDIDGPTVVSTDAAGNVGNGLAFLPGLSSDGRFVTFSSSSSDLITGDDNGTTFDVFRKDLDTGEVVRISERDFRGAGIGGGGADSFGSSISADGAVVAFDSAADNLGGTASGTRDVLVTDAGSGDVDLVSIQGNTFAVDPSISADGTRIAFQATATGLAETDDAVEDTQLPRIFVRDLDDGSLTEVSTAASGPEDFANDPSFDPDISANGRFVVFESDATNLVDEDLGGFRDIFIKDLDDGSIELVSSSDGAQGNASSSDATVSSDGRFVAFDSRANFVGEDVNGVRDIYVRDMQTDEMTLVTINQDGVVANGASFSPSISDDGRFVAFRSEASNLVDGDDNGIADIFVADLDTGELLRFELDTDTSGADRELVEPVISGDGSRVAYLTGVEAAGDTSLTASQVTVAPVDFGASPAAVADLETLITPSDVV